MVTQSDVLGWEGHLDALLAECPTFARAEPRRRAAAYLRGLLAPVERKNGCQLAEADRDATPDGVQELRRARWNADAVRNDLQAYVVELLGDADAVLVLNETGFLDHTSFSIPFALGRSRIPLAPTARRTAAALPALRTGRP